MMRANYRSLLLVTAVLWVTGFGRAASETVTATLEPAQISVGEQADLTVSVSGTSGSEPSIPRVDGLEFRGGGQSTQIQIINGAVTGSVNYTYSITPQRVGTFTIPAIKAGDSQSEPLTLKVLASASAPNPSYGFLQINVAKKEFYVGEVAPVDLKAFVPSGLEASVRALPTMTSEAFALNALGNKPQRSEEVVEGKRYTVLIWRTAMTAVKAGDYPLNAQMPIVVVVRERNSQRGMNTPFDSIFNNPFFSRGSQKEVTLVNEPQALKILPLPTANRPANFSGAIGSFEIEASARPQSVAIGDPVTLKLTIKGQGNFDRVSTEMLPNGNGWKTYPPKGTFEPADSAGYEGAKTFEQLAIPTDAGANKMADLTFAYFDTDKKQYITRTAPPLSVQVSGTPAPATAPAVVGASVPAVTASANAPAPLANPLDALVPNKIESGAYVATLRPLFFRPWFIGTQFLPILMLAGGIVYLRRKHHMATDPLWLRSSATRKAIQAQFSAMDVAMQSHQAEAFFTAARRAVQQKLGERWSIAPDSVTMEEVHSRLNGEADNLRPLFEMADHASYSGQTLNDADYRHWKEMVTTQMERLDKMS